MTEELSKAAIETANWWAAQIGAPTFDAVGRQPGADSLNMELAGAMQSMTAERHPVTKEAGNRFAEWLAATVDAQLARGLGCTLSVDYGPDGPPSDAAVAAGVSGSRFPWKTTSWTYPDYVTAKTGCGAQAVLVWASDDWLATRPTCDNQLWDRARQDEGYNGEPFACSLPKYHEGGCQHDRPIELCATCGSRDDWYHDAERRGHMPDFHEFVAPVEAEA